MHRVLLGLLAVGSLVCQAQTKPAGPCTFPGFDAALKPDPNIAEVAAKGHALSYIGCGPNDCIPEPVKAGSPVLIYSAQGHWTCGYSDGAGPAWFRSSDLRLLRYSLHPALAAWEGTWTQADDRIHIGIVKGGAGLHIRGHATWHGRAGIEHFGDVEGNASPSGNQLHLATDGSDGCIVDLVLAGRLILANDNSRCGGMNVRFWGFWRRAASQ